VIKVDVIWSPGYEMKALGPVIMDYPDVQSTEK
jgi:hypothetical protein